MKEPNLNSTYLIQVENFSTDDPLTTSICNLDNSGYIETIAENNCLNFQFDKNFDSLGELPTDTTNK